MTDTEARVLAKCFDLEQEIAAKDPEVLFYWHRERWVEEMQHGPQYKCSEWFGPQSPAQTKKFQRTISKLEQKGLLARWARYGEVVTIVKLTERGSLIAEELVVRRVDHSDSAVA